MNPRERLAAIEAELRSIHQAAGDEPLADDQQTRWDELAAERAEVNAAIERDDKRRDFVRSLADRPAHTEPADGARNAPGVIVKKDPYEVLASRGAGLSETQYRREVVDSTLRAMDGRIDESANQSHFERLLKRHASDTRWATNLLARARPEYESGFAKLMTGDAALLSDEERAAVAVGTNTAGGFLVPTHLDPTIILTNVGTSNIIRSISRVVTLTEGSTWNGVTSAGTTASFDAELAEVSDDSPTFGRVSVPVYPARSLVQASIEAFQDIANLSGDVLMMFADARDRLEGAAHAVGTGSGQPTGIFTALDANTNVEVVSTTAATIGLVDIHGLYRAVPVRWRSRSTWLMNPLFSLAIKSLGTALSASYTTDLTQPVADRLLGRPLVESDDAPSAQTTTALDNQVVFGDFSNYVIVDKPGGMSVEFIPHLFNTANNLPDGRRGWFAHWRTGADSVNDVAFRLLQDRTSA